MIENEQKDYIYLIIGDIIEPLDEYKGYYGWYTVINFIGDELTKEHLPHRRNLNNIEIKID